MSSFPSSFSSSFTSKKRTTLLLITPLTSFFLLFVLCFLNSCFLCSCCFSSATHRIGYQRYQNIHFVLQFVYILLSINRWCKLFHRIGDAEMFKTIKRSQIFVSYMTDGTFFSQKHCNSTDNNAGLGRNRMKYKRQNETEWCSSKKSARCVCVRALLIHTGLWSLVVSIKPCSLFSYFTFQNSLLGFWYSSNRAPKGINYPIPSSMIYCRNHGRNLTTKSNRKHGWFSVLVYW